MHCAAQQFAGPNGTNYQCKYLLADIDPHYVRLTCLEMCVFVDTEEQKKRFREDPQHGLKYRKMMESELNQRFKFIVQGTPEQKASLEVRGLR